MIIKLSELADKLGLEYTGADCEISGVNTLEKAGPGDISFLANPKYVGCAQSTKASCVLLSPENAHLVERALITNGVYLDLSRIIQMFAKEQGCLNGHSPQAYIHPEAVVDPSATIYPFAFVGRGARIGEGTQVFPGCYVGEDTVIGRHCLLYPNAVIMGGIVVGDDCILHPGVVLGGDGFGFAQTPMGHMKIPQIGTVEIADNVEIGSNTAVDRAALDVTRIGAGTKIDNLVQIGHNSVVGRNVLIVSQVALGGSAVIGDNVVIAGHAAVSQGVKVGDNCVIGPKSGVPKDLEPGEKVMGIFANPAKLFLKAQQYCFPRLPELFKRVKKLEKELERLEKISKGDAL